MMLVHGEAEKMEFLKQKIVKEFGKELRLTQVGYLQVLCHAGIDCFMPANGETVTITTQSDIPVKVSDRLLKRALEEYNGKVVFPDPLSHMCTCAASSIIILYGSMLLGI